MTERLLEQIMDAMSRASVGRFEARVPLDEEPPLDEPLVAAAHMLNVLLADLEHRDEVFRRARRREAQVSVRETFLTAINHDIRTPVSVMLSAAELLATTPLDATQQDLVNRMDVAGRHLLALVDDVLDYTRLEDGDLRLHMLPVDVREVIAGSIEVIESEALTRGIRLTADVQPPGDLRGIADGLRLRRVILNLVGNALKFTPRGGEVHVSAAVGAGALAARTLSIAVRDSGIGIAPDAIERIFEPFTQVDSSSSRSHDGSGLGLTISRRIIAEWGGTLTVESVPGAGSTFRLEVPLPVPTSEPPAATPAVSDAREPLGALRILLAEDHPTMRQLTVDLLEHIGVTQVDAVADGVAAVEHVQLQQPDVVLMDVRMPGMDGLTATRRVRQDWTGRPGAPYIVALTANATVEDRVACRAAGADAFLSKPVTAEDLQAVLQAAATPRT